jgi:hypothetical protein
MLTKGKGCLFFSTPYGTSLVANKFINAYVDFMVLARENALALWRDTFLQILSVFSMDT